MTTVLHRPETSQPRERRHVAPRWVRQATVTPQDQAAALERLIFTLEASTPGARLHRIPIPRAGEDRLSQLARLRAAHAAYSLATGNAMYQEGEGAWIRSER